MVFFFLQRLPNARNKGKFSRNRNERRNWYHLTAK